MKPKIKAIAANVHDGRRIVDFSRWSRSVVADGSCELQDYSCKGYFSVTDSSWDRVRRAQDEFVAAQIESRPLAVFLTWQQVIDLSKTHAPDFEDEMESSAEVLK